MTRALITISSASDRERACKWAQQAPTGSRVEFKAPKRSIDQNSLLWVWLTQISLNIVWYGQKLTPDDWKDMFTSALRKARVVPGIDPGSFVLLGLHTSDMSKDEMGNLLDLIDAFAAERGVTLEDRANTDSNSLQPSVSPDVGADTPAAEVSPQPAAAGVPNSSGLPQGWEIRLRAALADARSPDGLVDAARRCFDKIGARPTDPRDIDTAKAIRKAFAENFGQPDAINDAVWDIV